MVGRRRRRRRKWMEIRYTAEAVWMNPSSHTCSHSLIAHHGCLNPHSPPQSHRIVSSRWYSQGFSTYKHFFWNNLPNASFKDVHVFYLVTSWRQGHGSLSSKTLWNEELCQRILSDTFQHNFRWFCWLHMLRFCFKLIYLNH